MDSDDFVCLGFENYVGSEVVVFLILSKKGMVVCFEGIIRLVVVIFVFNILFFMMFMFFRCLYKFIFFLGIRNLCKLVGDEFIFRKELNFLI